MKVFMFLSFAGSVWGGRLWAARLVVTFSVFVCMQQHDSSGLYTHILGSSSHTHMAVPLAKYIHTEKKIVFKTHLEQKSFHAEQENITIQIRYACSMWTHHSPGLLSFCYRVTGVLAECKYRATCSLLAWQARVWTVPRKIQAHINNLTLW